MEIKRREQLYMQDIDAKYSSFLQVLEKMEHDFGKKSHRKKLSQAYNKFEIWNRK